MVETPRVSAAQIGRWLAVAGIILAGLVLYFLYAPDTWPVVTTMREAAR